MHLKICQCHVKKQRENKIYEGTTHKSNTRRPENILSDQRCRWLYYQNCNTVVTPGGWHDLGGWSAAGGASHRQSRKRCSSISAACGWYLATLSGALGRAAVGALATRSACQSGTRTHRLSATHPHPQHNNTNWTWTLFTHSLYVFKLGFPNSAGLRSGCSLMRRVINDKNVIKWCTA